MLLSWRSAGDPVERGRQGWTPPIRRAGLSVNGSGSVEECGTKILEYSSLGCCNISFIYAFHSRLLSTLLIAHMPILAVFYFLKSAIIALKRLFIPFSHTVT